MNETDIIQYIDLPRAEASESDFSPAEREALNTVNDKVNAAPSLDEVMRFVFETTRDICPCDRIGLAFLSDDELRLAEHLVVADYKPLVVAKGYSEALEGSSLERVIRSGTLRIINDLEAYYKAHPQSRSTPLLLEEGVWSSMTCPLSVDGRPVGVLFRSARKPNAYNEHTARVHLAMAERLSQTIEKAYRIDQLARTSAAYAEMFGFVSHELKSPVASMLTELRLISEGYLGEIPPEQSVRLKRMILKGEYLLGLIRDYLDLARIEGGELKAKLQEDVDLVEDIITPVIEVVRPQIKRKNVWFQRQVPSEPIHVECDPSLLKTAVVNFLDNAVKYGNERGKVRLSVTADDDRVTVSVWNEGLGFGKKSRNDLFKRFSRLKTLALRGRKGTGVGLYTVWRIIHLHHGRVDAKSERGEWAEFSFWIPRRQSAVLRKNDAS